MTYRHPLAFLLGLEGVALLRAFAGDGFDREFTEERVAEVRALLAHAAEFEEGTDFGEVDTVAGYRAWAATYDQPGNPLIDVEQPLVRQILDRIPPGWALDVACGTGRYAAYLSEHGHQVLGIDSSSDMLARARGRVPGARLLPNDQAGGPLARTWSGVAADATYEGTPAAIIWHFQRAEG